MTNDPTNPPRVCYTPIGVIRSSNRVAEQTPVQPVYAEESTGQAEILPEYAQGLKDLDGFSHIILIYHLHQAQSACLIVKPFTDVVERGVFSTRHPRRPNPIGFSVVRLLRVEGTTLYLQGVDVLDQTPLLDIKPYIPRFDQVENAKGGWSETVSDEAARRRGRRTD